MENPSGRLFHLGLLRFSGPDSLTFLQGQVSNDTRGLAAGRPLIACYSNPQGRVLAVMHLLPHTSGVVAALPLELALPIAERLRKFVLRSKVQIEVTDERLAIAGQHGRRAIDAAGLRVPDPEQGYLEIDGIGIGRVSGDLGRFWVVGESARLGALGLSGDLAATEEIELAWRLADIRAGIPQIYAVTRELFVAQMLNLDLIGGISFSKGCYTGQEIIARTQHLGRIKRRMHRLLLPPGDYAIGQSIALGDGRSGRLTELARTAAGIEALAVLHLDADGGATAVAATELPLPYALGALAVAG